MSRSIIFIILFCVVPQIIGANINDIKLKLPQDRDLSLRCLYKFEHKQEYLVNGEEEQTN